MRNLMSAPCVWVVLLAVVTTVRAGEEKVELSKLPKAVAEAVKKKFPKAELVSASKEVEDKKTRYEVRIKDGKQTVEVTATPAGEIVEVEKEIAAADLPKAVRDALEKKYPGAKIDKAEAIFKGRKLDEQTFEVLIVTADKKTYEVKLDPEGKVLATEDKSGEKGDKKDEVGVTG